MKRVQTLDVNWDAIISEYMLNYQFRCLEGLGGRVGGVGRRIMSMEHEKWSRTTRMTVFPWDLGRLVIKN